MRGTLRQIEIRPCGEAGCVPLALESDLGEFREMISPGAFKKTLQESRALSTSVSCDHRRVHFPGARSISFEVIRETWAIQMSTGAPFRAINEVRLKGVSARHSDTQVSARALRIAKGVRRDFEQVKRPLSSAAVESAGAVENGKETKAE